MKLIRPWKGSLFVVAAALIISGCGPREELGAPAAGGLAGAAVGAGTGALIGSAMASGDVAASALLGGAIGIPIGILAGIAYDHYTQRNLEEERRDLIRTNQQTIFERQRELELMRERLEADAPRGLPDYSLRERNPFVGPSLGNHYR